MTMEKKYILKIDDFEHRVLVNALNSNVISSYKKVNTTMISTG